MQLNVALNICCPKVNLANFFIPDTYHRGAAVKLWHQGSTHLHLELKVLILPLSTEEVSRDADLDGFLPIVGVGSETTRDQVLQRKSRRNKTKRERNNRKNGGEQSVDLKANERKDQKSVLLVQRLSDSQITLDRGT